MQLDTRKPLVVLLGAWNPTIFRPEWVAHHILDLPIGQQITIRALQDANNLTPVIYLGDIGYRAADGRFEVYAQTLQQSSFQLVAGFVSKLFDTLPHTPFGDYGINFHFLQNEPSDHLFSLLSANDNLDDRYTIISQEFKSKIKYTNKCELNFSRSINMAASLATFSFNYHNSVDDRKDLSLLTADYLMLLLTDSMQTLREIYSLDKYDELTHPFEGLPERQGGDDGEST